MTIDAIQFLYIYICFKLFYTSKCRYVWLHMAIYRTVLYAMSIQEQDFDVWSIDFISRPPSS